MLKFNYLYYLVLSLMFIFSACKEEGEELPGQAPTVDAGQDVTATVGSAVQLSGTASDPDGDPLTTSWSITSAPQGSSASTSNASSLTASFTPDQVGNYTLRLTADDGVYDPITDELIITAEEAVGEPPVVIIRNADNDAIDETNNEVTINTAYELDGSQSSDPDSEDLTFTWEITEGPEDSEATITPDEEGNMASFKADLLGTYIIRLSIQDPEGNIDSETVELVATANPVIIDENVTVATTWPNIFDDPNLPDYLVSTNLTVSEKLTVMPGVKVMFEPNMRMSVSGNAGALTAQGKTDSLIVFTAQDSVNGWEGIMIFNNNALNELSYADVSYGGNRDATSGVEPANVGLEGFGNGRLKINNTSFSNSFGDGLFVEDGASIPEFENNTFNDNTNHPVSLAAMQVGSLDINSTFSGNGENTVQILQSNLNMTEMQTWPALAGQTSYNAPGSLVIQSPLTIMEGAAFEFGSDGYIQINGDAYLIAAGTETDSIKFTAEETANGWGGIIFFSDDNRNELSFVSISYAGNRTAISGVLPSSIGLEGFSNSKLKLSNSTIANSLGDYGLFAENNAFINEFANNRFVNNEGLPIGLSITAAGILDEASTFAGNGTDAVEIFGSTLTDNISLVAFTDGTPYRVSGKLDIDSDLTVNPGATLEVDRDVILEVGNSGGLIAIGEEDNMITITASDVNEGWSGITIFSSKSSNQLTYCNISYGGNRSAVSGILPANVGLEGFSQSRLKLTNCALTNSFGYGLFVESNAAVTDANGLVITTQQGLEDAGNAFSENVTAASDFDL